MKDITLTKETELIFLTLSWRWSLSYRNQSIDLLRKSMDWFLYDNGLRHEKVNENHLAHTILTKKSIKDV